jgi:hypothetical protein
VVPDLPDLRNSMLHELYDTPYSGHVGITKTLKSVKHLYWWPKLKSFVIDCVQSCAACQRNKSSSQKPAGVLHRLPIPDYPWSSVSMDFITRLPKAAGSCCVC